MSWFRSKPESILSFKEEGRAGLCDLHAHLLSGLDDGAVDIDESNAMLDHLEMLGFVKVASTPHFNNTTCEPSARRQQVLIDDLMKRRDNRGPEMTVGAEILFDDIFLEKERQGLVPGIGGRPIYLVEFGFLPSSVPIAAEERSFRFHIKEKQLILAHPERIPDLQRDLGKVKALRRSGMLFQLDVMSLVGKYGRQARRTALSLLERNMIDLAATDLHRARDFDTLVAAMSTLLAFDRDLFERLFSTVPSLIHEGRIEEIVQDA